jgi:hypothetical protein
VEVFQANFHGPHIDTQFFEAREEIEEVVGSQSQLCRLDIMRGEVEGSERESSSK